MYKIDDINGEVSLVVYLEDEDKKEYYSCWYYELQELNNLSFKGVIPHPQRSRVGM